MISSVRYPYDDTVVLLTGAGDGIGRAIARGFAEQGARVCGLGRTEATLRETFADFPTEQTMVQVADVSAADQVDAAVAAVVERFGRLDVVVPNAAVYEPGGLADISDEQWQRMQRINVDGVFFVVRAAVPHLQASGGNVVAVSSVSALRGDWGQFAYNATKGATKVMLQSLALDLGPSGVRVNLVAPALTVTRVTRGVVEQPGFAEALANRVPLVRPGQPEDVARAVLFLASPDAAYITGAVLPVDGGTSASTGQAH